MKPSPQLALTLLRLVLGALLLLSGYQKFALSGLHGVGLQGVAAELAALGLPLPGVLAPVLAVAELLGGALMMAGVATRPLAAVLGLLAVAQSVTPLVQASRSFTLSAYQYPLLLLACAAAVALGSEPGRGPAKRGQAGRGPSVRGGSGRNTPQP
ncbi:DoxX family protein [Deinococcus sp.]|uniref:DoxX family protein n=1 Tax=Deinococcus sp. TaxID=47478 RepID=UPI0025F30F5E|nr:DoxX family protein [Deinococcus sp.]